MKKSNLIKTLIISATALFAINSCGNVNQIDSLEKEEKSTLKVSVTDTERTVMPVSNLNELTDFELSYYNNNTGVNDWVPLYTSTSLEELQNTALDLPITLVDNVAKDFRLTAKKGSLEYSATVNTRITMGENAVTFALRLTSLGTGNGGVSYTVDFSQANTSNLVKKVIAVLENAAGNNLGERIFSGNDIANGQIVYSLTGISSGCYTIKVSLYADENQIANLITWYEVVQIAADNTSTGRAEIKSFNGLYDITYNYNYTLADGTAPAKVKEKVSHLTTTLKTPEREGYIFLGWFREAECENKAYIPVPYNTEVYAKWLILKNSDGSYNATVETLDWVLSRIEPASTSAENPVLIHITGLENERSIGSILNKYPNTYVNLDLTQFTLKNNYEGVAVYEFKDCTTLKKIKLANYSKIYDQAFINSGLKEIEIPASVTDIRDGAFANCNSLTDIIVSPDNTKYKSEGNVLYSKDGTILYKFPTARTGTFAIPDSVIKIMQDAFKNASISTITFPETAGGWCTSTINYVLDESSHTLSASSMYDLLSNRKTSVIKGTPTQVANIFKNTAQYIYHIQLYKYAQETQPQVYPTVSTDASNNFTMVTTSGYLFYKIQTEVNQGYNLQRLNSSTRSSFTNVPSDLGSAYITVFSSEGHQLNLVSVGSFDSGSYINFVAKTSETYIAVDASGKCAFRVALLDTSVKSNSVTVSAVSEIRPTKVRVGNAFIYSYDTAGQWYVNDVLKSGSSASKNYTLDLDNYETGSTITLMFKVKISNNWYSYTEQITIE